ncbi:ATP-binding protein [Candidatus Micrarchaeota archaeon]|nr:ATP-binding protein [Candidatus Micrarchaeota archaeon]
MDGKVLKVKPLKLTELVFEKPDNLLAPNTEHLSTNFRVALNRAVARGDFDNWLHAIGYSAMVNELEPFKEGFEEYQLGYKLLKDGSNWKDPKLVPVGEYFRHMDVLFSMYAKDNDNYSKLLLYGAPGCGKTASARHFTAKYKLRFMPRKANHFSYDSPGKDYGEHVFHSLRKVKGCVMFVDEIDLVGAKRDGQHIRPSNTLLTELDGLQDNPMVFVGATNQPWVLDSALLRSGRIDYCFYVPTPNEEERLKLLEMYSKGKFLADLNALAQATEFYSCADLKTICHKARVTAALEGKEDVSKEILEKAVEQNPSTAVEWLEEASKLEFSANYRKRFSELWDEVKHFKTSDSRSVREVAALAVA